MSNAKFKKPRKTTKNFGSSTQEYFPSSNPVPLIPSKCHIRWTKTMEEVMLDALYEDVLRNGKRADNGLKTDSLRAAAKAVNTTLKMHVTSEHVRTRLKTLRKDYKIASTLLKLSGFGFTFNSESKTVLATDDDVWERYFEAHPNSRNLRGKHFPYFEQLSVIVGDDAATGEDQTAGDEEPLEYSPYSEEGADNDLDDEVLTPNTSTSTSPVMPPVPPVIETSTNSIPVFSPRLHQIPAPASAVKSKRKKSRYEPESSTSDQIAHGILDAVGQLAAAFGGPKIETVCAVLKEVCNGDKALFFEGIGLFGS